MEWKKIDGSLFEVSSTGLIRRIGKDSVLKPGVDAGGYYIIPVHYEDGTRKTKRLHRLIAGAFIPNPEGLPEVDHINRNRTDNTVENLRWVSKSKNQWNKGTQKNNTTGFTGIHSADGNWEAAMWHLGKKIYIGRFDTLEAAVDARAKLVGELRT